MSKLVSMKIDAAERERAYAPSAVADSPTYPWGLGLTLDQDALEKLGVDKLPDVGETLRIEARVSVTSISASDSKGEGGKTHKSRSLGLQITDLCLEKDEGDGGSAADKLYGK